MKLKFILTTLLIALCTTAAMAQRKPKPQKVQQHYTSQSTSSLSNSVTMVYGVAAGVTIPNLVIEGNGADVSNNVGFKAGIMWGADFGNIEIVPELWYSTFTIDFTKDNAGLKGAELKNSSIDFPIMVGFDITSNLKLHVGPSFSLMCNNDLTLKNGDMYEFGSIKSSVGYVAGLSYNIISNFVIDLRYSGRFTSNSNEFESSYDAYKIRMSTIDITAGFRF
ncbi:MAG: outer membrane beta-barrel protein [Rikenellaceae bacterium]